MPDTEHIINHVSKAREALHDLETHIIDLFPSGSDEFMRVALLEGVAKVRSELKFLHYTANQWAT